MTRPHTRRSAYRTLRALVLVALVGVVGVGCTTAVQGEGIYANGIKANAAPSDLVIKGSDGSDIDQLAANSLDDIIAFWDSAFPDAFGKPLADLSGGYVSYSPDQQEQVPCVGDAKDAAGNAFYCPSADLIAYDRDFLAQLAEDNGDFIVTLVLSHEFGHAIQSQVGDPSEASINIETQADCFAGVFVQKASTGTAHFEVTDADLDAVLGGYLFFRDDPGGSASEPGSHGSAFDRVAGFQDGYEKGPSSCADDFGDDRIFTEIPFTAAEQATQGNEPFADIIGLSEEESELFWTQILSLDPSYEQISLESFGQKRASCDGEEVPDLVYYCAPQETIFYSEKLMQQAYGSFGDFAVFELFALEYADAAITAADVELDGEERFTAELCMTGGFAGDAFLLTQSGKKTLAGSSLSAGDLDEAIVILIALESDDQILDTAGTNAFDRVTQFRKGFDLVKASADKVTDCLPS